MHNALHIYLDIPTYQRKQAINIDLVDIILVYITAYSIIDQWSLYRLFCTSAEERRTLTLGNKDWQIYHFLISHFFFIPFVSILQGMSAPGYNSSVSCMITTVVLIISVTGGSSQDVPFWPHYHLPSTRTVLVSYPARWSFSFLCTQKYNA